MPEITGIDKVERLPVTISHLEGEQLLGAPKIDAGTGANISQAVYELLVDWNVKDRVVAACFDTTASNTGIWNGAAVLLEQKLERSLMYLPCRHHVYELFLGAAFESKFGSTSGKNVQIFTRFQTQWKNLNKSNFKSLMDDEIASNRLQNHAQGITAFCMKQLERNIVRDDYKELLELVVIFLGAKESPTFRNPGPMHHARWMSKAIYSLKVYMFRDEFRLTPRETANLRDICMFIIRFYVKGWFRCTLARAAPNQDFVFLQELNEYKNTDGPLANAVINKIVNHLWYLSDEAIALAFFDSNLSVELRGAMAVRFLQIENEFVEENEGCKRIQLKLNGVEQFVDKTLVDFITPNTVRFFNRFKISRNFLHEDPHLWADDDEFLEGLLIVNRLAVVNDSAERAVKLMEDYNKVLTKDEQQKQFLLQVVSDYRQKFPSHTKQALGSTKK